MLFRQYFSSILLQQILITRIAQDLLFCLWRQAVEPPSTRDWDLFEVVDVKDSSRRPGPDDYGSVVSPQKVQSLRRSISRELWSSPARKSLVGSISTAMERLEVLSTAGRKAG